MNSSAILSLPPKFYSVFGELLLIFCDSQPFLRLHCLICFFALFNMLQHISQFTHFSEIISHSHCENLFYSMAQLISSILCYLPVLFVKVLLSTTEILFFLFLKLYLFMRDTEKERQRHRQREKQAPWKEPDAGLDPGTPRPCPRPKAGAKPLSHPEIPLRSFSVCS